MKVNEDTVQSLASQVTYPLAVNAGGEMSVEGGYDTGFTASGLPPRDITGQIIPQLKDVSPFYQNAHAADFTSQPSFQTHFPASNIPWSNMYGIGTNPSLPRPVLQPSSWGIIQPTIPGPIDQSSYTGGENRGNGGYGTGIVGPPLNYGHTIAQHERTQGPPFPHPVGDHHFSKDEAVAQMRGEEDQRAQRERSRSPTPLHPYSLANHHFSKDKKLTQKRREEDAVARREEYRSPTPPYPYPIANHNFSKDKKNG